MNIKTIRTAFTSLVILFTLTCCGQKGPLYIAEEQNEQNEQESIVEKQEIGKQEGDEQTVQKQEAVESPESEKTE